MKKYILLLILAITSFSCSNDFEEINTNHNDPEEVDIKYLLPTVIFNLSDKMCSVGYDFGEIVAQYGGYYEYNEIDIYNWGATKLFWDNYSYLSDLSDIKNKAVTSENKNYEAISLILESYMISLITDTYGHAPYSEAMAAKEKIYTPKYDHQQDIYDQIFTNLEKANQIINDTDEVEGDILFNGNMTLWKKFANSLRVRFLMRISNKVDVKSKLQEIISNPTKYPLIENNSENAVFAYAGSYPNAAPISKPRGARYYGYELIVPTTKLIQTLESFNDPRLQEWVDPKTPNMNDYIGLTPGLPLDQIGEPSEYARRAMKYYNSGNKAKAWFITYSELNFLLSEASNRGLVSGSAKDYYDKAVEASFEQWGVPMPTDYLTAQAPYNATNDILYIQKWLSLYHSGVEAWLDWKRTSKPDFITPGPGAQINEVPRRLIYPSIEQSINSESYNQAVDDMGGDKITLKVWWDNF